MLCLLYQKSGFLLVLMLNVPVNNLLVMFGQFRAFMGKTSAKQWIQCLAQGHNTVTLLSLKLATI